MRKRQSISSTSGHELDVLNSILGSIPTESSKFFNSISLLSNHSVRPKQIKMQKRSKAKLQTHTQTKTTISPAVTSFQSNRSKRHQSQPIEKLLKQLFVKKSQKLSIGFNQEKYQSFVSSFHKKNSQKPQEIETLDLSALNLRKDCEDSINSFIVFTQPHCLKLHKNQIEPNRLELHSIKELYLGNNGLGNDSICRLFSSLAEYGQIRLIDLNSPEVKDKNHLTSYQQLYQLIKSCSTLEVLGLCNLGLKKDNHIFQSLKNSSVRQIDLSRNPQVGGISPALTHLNLSQNELRNGDLLVSQECKSRNDVTFLDISSNPIPFHELQGFLKPVYFSSLLQLNLNNLLIDRECVALQEFIWHSHHLRAIHLENCQLSENSWRNVVCGLKNSNSLEEVSLTHNDLPNAKVATELGESINRPYSRLKKIKLNKCNIRDEYGAIIFKQLASNKTLQYLDLSENKLGVATGITLAVSLKTNIILKHLNIDENCISYSVSQELEECIDRNRFLEIENIKAEYKKLENCPQIYNAKAKELEQLECQLQEIKAERNALQERVYRIQSQETRRQCLEFRAMIKEYQGLENSLIAHIDVLEDQIYDLGHQNGGGGSGESRKSLQKESADGQKGVDTRENPES